MYLFNSLMRRVKPFWAVFLGLILLAQAKSAEKDASSADIEISAQVSKTTIRLGDTLTFTIRLIWPGEQDRYLMEDLAPPGLENLRLAGTKTELSYYEENQTEFTRKVYLFYLTGDSTGPAKISPLTINYYDTRTDKSSSFVSPAYKIKVTAPIQVGRRFVWFLLAVAILLGLGYVLRLYRKLKRPPSESLPGLTIEQQTLGKLEVMPTQDIKNALNHLRKIVIEYLESKCEQKLSGQTTSEILRNLNSFSGEKKQLLKEILEECDQARFDPGAADPLSTQKTLKKFRMLLEPEPGQPVE